MAKRSLHSKLDQVRRLVVTSPKETVIRPAPERYHLLADQLGAELICGLSGNYCFTRRCCPPTYSHGTLAYADSLHRTEAPVSAFTPGEDAGSVCLDRIRFFDLETVGMGGSGTVGFLVGVGSLTEAGFEVRQYLLPDYEDEAALLEGVASEFDDQTVLASYNGAAFDLPILRDRFIVNRVGREVPHCRHIDLLHVSRRLFRRRLGDCSLGNIEREVFQFFRTDDIPGYLVPSAYLDWLATQQVGDLGRVMEHNFHDIVSLYFLTVLVADIFDTYGDTLDRVDDLHSLSRIFGRRRRFDRTVDLNRRVEDLGGERLAPDVLLFHAQTFKRCGDYDNAARIWQDLATSSSGEATDSRESYLACLELAVHYEHRVKDYAAALAFADRAARFPDLSSSRYKSLEKRRVRLRKKLSA